MRRGKPILRAALAIVKRRRAMATITSLWGLQRGFMRLATAFRTLLFQANCQSCLEQDVEGSKNPLVLRRPFWFHYPCVDWGQTKQLGFFDVEEKFTRLSGLGDQLEAFSRTVNF